MGTNGPREAVGMEFPRPARARPGRARPPGDGLRLQLYGRAWSQALDTARRLVREFGAARVLVVGDLLHADRFDRGSTIELVAFGLHADVFRRAAVGHPSALPTAIHDGDHLAAAEAAALRAEGIELAHRVEP